MDERKDSGQYYPGGKIIGQRGVSPIGGDMSHSEFTSVTAPGASMKEMKAWAAEVTAKLKGGATLVLAGVLVGVTAAFLPQRANGGGKTWDGGELRGTNQVAEVDQERTTVAELAAFGGGGIDTNAVEGIVATYDATNLTGRIGAKLDAAWVGGGAWTNAVAGVVTNEVAAGFSAWSVGNFDETQYYSVTNVGIAIGTDPEHPYGPIWRMHIVGWDVVNPHLNIWVDCSMPEAIDMNATKIFANGPWNLSSTRTRIYANALGLAYARDVPTTNGLASAARVAAVETTVDGWEAYWRGDRVRLSVTNYYGNTSGDIPRLRIEESLTNEQGAVVGWRSVWDENTKMTNLEARVTNEVNAAIAEMTWTVETNVTAKLDNMAPRAWGTVTSAGGKAPANTIWMTEPNTMFAGGTEYAHVAVGEGVIAVLVDKGAPVYTEGDEGQFRFKDESGLNYFGFDVRAAYTIGCRTDGIRIITTNGTSVVRLVYDLVSSNNPEIMCTTNLADATSWTAAQATWEQNPPAGTKICYLNPNGAKSQFYKAQMTYQGGSKFVTNMQADLMGGIAATNETSNVIQSVEPYIVNGAVLWRVKQ